MNQQRNFVLFMVLTMIILIGGMWVQNQIWPPPIPPDNDNKQDAAALAKVPENKLPEYLAGMIAHGFPANQTAGPAQVAVQLSLAAPVLKYPKSLPSARYADLTLETKKALALSPPPMPLSVTALSQLAYLGTLRAPPAAPKQPVETVVLGGDDYHIQVVLTTAGAGVQKLTLNQFEAASWLGLPEGHKLELIQEDPYLASFLLYHFPDTEDRIDNPPVDTLGKQIWKLEAKRMLDDQVQEVAFSTKVPRAEHLQIIKTYRLAPRAYHVGLDIEIVDTRDPKSQDAKASKFRYQLAGAHGLPVEGEWYTHTFRNALIGTVDSRGNLWREFEDAARISFKQGGERVPEKQLGTSYIQYAGVATQYFTSTISVDHNQPSLDDGGVDFKKILAWARPTVESTEVAGQIIDIKDGRIRFLSKGDVRDYKMLPRVIEHLEKAKFKLEDKAVLAYYELDKGQRIATWIRRGQRVRPMLDDITVRVQSDELEFMPGERIQHRFVLYHGPVKVKLLGQLSGNRAVPDKLVDDYAYTMHLRTLTDYRSEGPMGWFAQKIMWTDLIIAVTNLMHWLLHKLQFVGQGLSIILLTVIVRGLMFPVSRRQAQFSVKMQEVAPELKKLQEKFKNDPKGRTEATMELYRKHNVHPLGGCLPIFLQMPIFIGLYFALQESIHFRLASFLWIPNLSAPDMLIWWGEGIPWISDPDSQGSMLYLGPFLNLLPIIAVSLMIAQQVIMSPPPQDEQQAMQFKMMRYMMIFFGILFYKVAAGLCLYFIASSLWGLAERKLLPKKPKLAIAEAHAKPPSSGAGPGPSGKKPTGPGPSGRKPPKGKGGKGGKNGKAEPQKESGIQKAKDWWAEVLKQARKK